jgi:hypothetical protein
MARRRIRLRRSGVGVVLAVAIWVALSLSMAQAAADGNVSGITAPVQSGVQAPDCPSSDSGSTAGYADPSASQAEQLFTHSFPCILDQLAADPPGAQTDAGATGSTTSTDPLASVAPLRTSDGTPVDLTLDHQGDGYVPANPLVDATLPDNLGHDVPVGDRGIAIDPGATEPGAAGAASAEPLGGEGLFYANAAPQTDVLLAPITPGLETVYQLRGTESPEHLQMGLKLPAGASLQSTFDGGAEVVEAGQPVATLYPPLATDANGNSVAATMAVGGDSLDIDVPHSDPGMAYPIAVTASAGSFVPAAATVAGSAAAATAVTPGIDGVDPAAATQDGNGTLTTEGDQAAALGVQVVRYTRQWCDIERAPGVYTAPAIQKVLDFVHSAHQASPSLKALVTLTTSAPNFASTYIHHAPCANASDGGSQASIAPSSGNANATDYGLTMKKLAQCLNASGQCNGNNDLNCDSDPDPDPGCTVTTYGHMLDDNYVYGFEAGNEPNISAYWWNGTGKIQPADADIYWHALAAAASAVHAYSPGSLVGSAGLSYGSPDGKPWGDDSGTVDGTTYLDRLLSDGNSGANAYSIHPYGPGLHPDMVTSNGIRVNNDVYQDTGWARALLISYGYGYAKPIWITEVGVDADQNDDDIPPDQVSSDEAQQANKLYDTWWNSIRAICSSDNVPLASFWTFKDAHPYMSGDKYYAGFAKIAPGGAVDYTKVAYAFFDAGQFFSTNTCTG